MAHYDRIIDDPEQAPDRRPAARRRIHALLIALCGFLMLIVLLSTPRVSKVIETAGTSLSERIGRLLPLPADEPETVAAIPAPVPVSVIPETGADGGEVVSRNQTTGISPDASPARPVVRVLPQSRVPIRRLGAGN